MRPTLLILLAAMLTAGFVQPDARDAGVRRAIARQYERLERALETRDLALFESVRSATFNTRNLEGVPQTTQQMRERSRLLFSVIQPPIDAEFEILSLRQPDRNTAIVTIRQSFSRMQNVRGEPHRVATRVDQDETWVLTPCGWRLQYVDNERNLLRFIDGRRIRPGPPLDPDAPLYDPDGEAASPAEREVRALERRWLDAYERADAAAMRTILADDFVITFPDGRMQTKAAILRQLAAGPAAFAGSRFRTRDVLSRLSGDTVVLTGILVSEASRDGQAVREENAYTDTWVRRDGRWQVMASHLATIQAAPPPR